MRLTVLCMLSLVCMLRLECARDASPSVGAPKLADVGPLLAASASRAAGTDSRRLSRSAEDSMSASMRCPCCCATAAAAADALSLSC